MNKKQSNTDVDNSLLDKLFHKSTRKTNKRQRKSSDQIKFSLTPKGILLNTLSEVYGIDMNINKVNEFSEKLISGLSNLATRGEISNLFGNDFNDFFQLYIETLNLCGRMREVLDENGIDFKINPNNGDQND